METIYFIDVRSRQPYTFETMAEKALGGAESTLLRVADRLAEDYRVFLVQACRDEDDKRSAGISYLSMQGALSSAASTPPDHVILHRKIKKLEEVARLFPSAKLYFYIQDLPVPKYCRYRQDLVRHSVEVICPSDWHRRETAKYFSPGCWFQRIFHPFSRLKSIHIRTIYNVIDPEIKYEPAQVDKDKLVFFSTPRKGLKEILVHFKDVIRVRPQTKLYIANPGYEAMDPEWVDHPNLINLGSLKNAEVVRHVREAFCVFYPQKTLPEGFGVVYAEANTVGTPVLCYDIGAASEVLSNPEQVLVLTDDDVTGRLMKWYEQGRPEIRGKPDYQLDSVVNEWKKLLG